MWKWIGLGLAVLFIVYLLFVPVISHAQGLQQPQVAAQSHPLLRLIFLKFEDPALFGTPFYSRLGGQNNSGGQSSNSQSGNQSSSNRNGGYNR